jgi:hypothetical protein
MEEKKTNVCVHQANTSEACMWKNYAFFFSLEIEIGIGVQVYGQNRQVP